ncbi:uncharacterized protein LOC108901709 isoform X6 [Lates calcarifer]|uniref:Uncharacterized protein LOC108901709 isoform X6 n=1 Tax=Lates calcarifer TaxID=8187 RepID=A0A4W6BTP7_LATCA|nr:uncharacterized protein LOC108901709 isoform X6 [Lates calcarifer]
MKLVILSLLVVLVVSQSEALKCNCGGIRNCPGRVETCYGSANVCISAFLNNPAGAPRHFKGCYNSRDCQLINSSGIGSASCCRTDLCN